MVIGIIGAGISGLTAGRLLARAGHEVTIIEKSKGYGGRMATRYAGKNQTTKLDHGLSWFHANSAEFQAFVAELIEKDLVGIWGDNFAYYRDGKFFKSNPTGEIQACYTAPKGMNSIGKYISRWVDVRLNTKVGGLTYIGSGRKKKRPWMINLTGADTIEADAVIIAVPAPQAYGILQTARDETDTLKIIRIIDDIYYEPAYTVMSGYGDRTAPDWDGIICKDTDIEFISNEITKRDNAQECSFVIHSTSTFAKQHEESDHDLVAKMMLNKAGEIAGVWAAAPEWHQSHYWRYKKAVNFLQESYLELENTEGPLALIGDYLAGNTVDHAYQSGYKLAKHWINKFGK